MGSMIMQRCAQDGYHAELIAQGMEDAGATVFSILNDPSGCIRVFCKYNGAVSPEEIDRKINTEVSLKAEYYEAV